MTAALLNSSIASLPLLARGKVRDNYAVGEDRILMVATDRLSAFDVVMGEPIPGKGELLTQMALFWFAHLQQIVPNHLTGDDPASVVAPDERDQVRGRSMLVRRLKGLPIEAVVRGYLAGSGWVEYQASRSVCGVALPAGLKNASRCRADLHAGNQGRDRRPRREHLVSTDERIVGADLAARVRDISIRCTRRRPRSPCARASSSPTQSSNSAWRLTAP
jgi:phosphoribosylaminoimidazole-succinocarboxamide synthase